MRMVFAHPKYYPLIFRPQVYLMSPFFVDYAMSGAYGVKMPRIGSERGNNALMPLPPLQEQQRIALQLQVIFSKLKDEI